MVHTNCSVYGCKSSSIKNKDLKFHRFPEDIARCQLWIEACRRSDLGDKNIEQLHNMHLCGLHFPKWMYMKKKLKNAAVPVLNLPPASLHHMSTQTETPKVEVVKYLNKSGVQHQTDIAPVGVSVLASTSTQALQTINRLTEGKTKLQSQITNCAKKMKLMEDDKSTDVTLQQFLQGCDKFLSPNLSKVVKAQVTLKPDSKNN